MALFADKSLKTAEGQTPDPAPVKAECVVFNIVINCGGCADKKVN